MTGHDGSSTGPVLALYADIGAALSRPAQGGQTTAKTSAAAQPTSSLW